MRFHDRSSTTGLWAGLRRAWFGRLRRAHHRQSSRAAVAVAVSGALALTVPARAAEGELELRIDLPAESFVRGCLNPVEGLVATLTVTNNAITASSLPVPRLDPVGGTEFEVYLRGAPYGIPTTPETPARTPVRRHVRLQPVGGNVMQIPGYTVKPGKSKEFELNVGRNYAFKAAGRYEIRRVDVLASVLLDRLEDYEAGEPDFPFMFYITQGQDRFDHIIYLVRAGSGAYEHYDVHGLGKVAPGVLPEMTVAGSKVGLLVPDKTNDNKTRFFVVDFGSVPMKAAGEEFVHEPGSGPSMSVDAEGNIVAR